MLILRDKFDLATLNLYMQVFYLINTLGFMEIVNAQSLFLIYEFGKYFLLNILKMNFFICVLTFFDNMFIYPIGYNTVPNKRDSEAKISLMF